jgi:polyhydroxyalkanoate synthesis regulator phasin
VILDDLRGYVQLASGLTEATTAKAKEAVSALVASGLTLSTRAMSGDDAQAPTDPAQSPDLDDLAADLLATSEANRQALLALVRAEVDKALGRLGIVREDELAALRRRVERLEQAAGAPSAPAPAPAPESGPPKAKVKVKVPVSPPADPA